ncbi:restriction endonuclease subunit S [Vibrio vulnificus]|uniref:restriction endonuclease subunit S n=1 Tax=Vibrio vulnificus TaxID=672 RepID=UPI0018DE9793|nr:restriction endonuclease subunit S [Vibrio vulnificus]EGR0788497.1 restriction endonuclease subunit S [Vibrio vulnificus]EGR0797069.1 restriction endonuclease subunit S [Vibrio vulnificus]EGR0813810.1 restriction endonuclease subunit S [Vibrio vulnificus]EGR0826206.1 restriction endonuclease subunit S [Vibrio vulnificus]EGR0848393.1 restriction endonuclease subunit S [Vibrio vulnificus]
MESIIAMPKYETYKDSGYAWIGNIPADWEISRLGACLTPVSVKNHPEFPLLSITRELGVIERDIEDQESNHNYIPDDLSSYKLLKKGQFGMNKMKAWQGSYGVSKYTGIVSPAYFIFDFAKAMNPEFFNWAIRSKLYVSYFGSASDGVRVGQWDLSKTRMKDIPFILPEEKQQELIAKFLDKKTSQIDEAISIKDQQIGLLKERKQIIIQQAVTQGLDPNVSMKDSGVEWIGKIPKHWKIKRIKHVTSKIGSGITPSGGGATYLDEGIPLLRSQNVHFDRIDIDDVARISLKTHNGMANSKVKKGDVLLNITGGSIGRCFYVDTNEEMNVNQHVCIVRPTKNIETIFLNAVLASEVGQGQIWFFQQGGGREGLNFQSLKNFWLALPPKQEQREIVNYINKISFEMNNIVDSLQKQISKIKDYRSSLINSAVTGKIKITPEMVEG